MSFQHHPASKEAGFGFVAVASLAAVLIFAPMIMGGNRPLPLLVLELAALGLLALCFSRPAFLHHLPKSFLIALAAFALLPLLQLLPLPWNWGTLPGRETYAHHLNDLFGADAAGWRSFSLVPHATEAAWFTVLPPLAVFLLTIGLSDLRLKQAVYVFLGLAAFQAVLGLTQYGTGSGTVFWPQYPTAAHGIGIGIGTYTNPNHLAGLLEMALPIALGMLACHYHGVRERARSYRHGLRGRLAGFFAHGIGFNRTLVFGAISLAILLGLVFSRSRTGIALGMLGLLLAALLFARHLGGRATRITTALSVLGLVLVVEIGLAPIMQRFGVDATEDSRWSIFGASLKAIAEFFPLGSGTGTYPEVFRRFQPGDISGTFINHAHNDYLEWLVENGLIGVALALVFFAFYLQGWRNMWTRKEWNALRFMQAGAGIALLLMMLHGLTDYNLHIPANAIYFAFLAATFLHRQEEKNSAGETTMPAPAPEVKPFPQPAPTNIPNPFDD